MTTTLTLDALAAVKEKQQATWASGDYAVIGTSLQIIGERLCESVDVSAGQTVLDVAAGNGNASLAAARRGCDVTATDYVESLLERARRRADADGVPLTTQVADAEDLPFEDASFDVVLSTVGVMFTPNPERAAAELLRVVRPGGRIGLASWTPEGFIGQMFKIVGAHVPAAGRRALAAAVGHRGSGRGAPRWRGEGGDRAQALHLPLPLGRRLLRDVQDVLRADFKAWGALDAEGQQSFRDQLIAPGRRAPTATPTVPSRIDSEYLEVVATRR